MAGFEPASPEDNGSHARVFFLEPARDIRQAEVTLRAISRSLRFETVAIPSYATSASATRMTVGIL